MADSYEFLKAQKDAIIEKQRSVIERRMLAAEAALLSIAQWPGTYIDDVRELALKTWEENHRQTAVTTGRKP